jgi:hypothetical protein
VSRASTSITRAGIGPLALTCVALLGAGLGSAWDLLHVKTGTTAYSIGAERLPLWVPLEFALVYMAGVVGIATLGSPRAEARAPRRLAAETAWVTVVYAMTALLHGHEWLVTLLALAGLAVRQRTLRELARANPLPAAALIVGGPVVESILIRAGLFQYAGASLGNVPVWLPLLYANAVPFAVRFAESALWFSRGAERQPA